MSYPVLYEIGYDYTAFAVSQGNNSFPGTQLDADLAGLQDSIEETNDFLKLAIRSDGKIKNGAIGFDQLSPELSIGVAPATVWVADTPYTAGISTVYRAGVLYKAIITHTSTDTFDTSKWDVIADFGAEAASAAASAAAASVSEGNAGTSETNAAASAGVATTKAAEATAAAASAVAYATDFFNYLASVSGMAMAVQTNYRRTVVKVDAAATFAAAAEASAIAAQAATIPDDQIALKAAVFN